MRQWARSLQPAGAGSGCGRCWQWKFHFVWPWPGAAARWNGIRRRHACLSNGWVRVSNPCIVPFVVRGPLRLFGEKGIQELVWIHGADTPVSFDEVRRLFPESVVSERDLYRAGGSNEWFFSPSPLSPSMLPAGMRMFLSFLSHGLKFKLRTLFVAVAGAAILAAQWPFVERKETVYCDLSASPTASAALFGNPL